MLSLLLFAQVVGQGFDRSLEQLERQQIITPAERRRVQLGSPLQRQVQPWCVFASAVMER